MDNQHINSNEEGLVQFLDINMNIAPVYMTRRAADIYKLICNGKYNSYEKDKIFKRLVRIFPIDQDIYSFCASLILVYENKDHKQYGENFGIILENFNNAIENIDKHNLRILTHILSLPSDHRLFGLIEESKLMNAIFKNYQDLLALIDKPADMLDFCKNYYVYKAVSANRDMKKLCNDKWSQLLQDVENLDDLRNILCNIHKPFYRTIIEERMVNVIKNRHNNGSSTVELFFGYEEVKEFSQGHTMLMSMILDSVSQSRGLDDICEYISKYNKVFGVNGFRHMALSAYIRNMENLEILSIYFMKLSKIEPYDESLIKMIRERCITLVRNVNPLAPDKWFLEYINNTETIPTFLKSEFKQKAEEILGY